MTATTERIVTALGKGPSTARELSQCLDGIGYANMRQTLHRLAKAGVVTKLRRGVYGLDTSRDCDSSLCDTASDDAARHCAPAPAASHPSQPTRRAAQADDGTNWTRALAQVRADFEAMNDPFDPRAWA